MKRILLIILVFAITSFSCAELSKSVTQNFVLSNNTFKSKYTFVIDAGHGGRDVGAVGVDGSLESNINLAIALYLYDYLMVAGVNAVLTRNGDYATYNDNDDRSKSDLYNRMDLVNSIENSVLISIHQNHFSNEKEYGTQIWYSPNNIESKVLADNVLMNINNFIQPNNQRKNKVSDKNYYLLYKAVSPSIMVECGFISNREENNKLQDSNYQNKMAFAIFIGTCEEI